MLSQRTHLPKKGRHTCKLPNRLVFVASSIYTKLLETIRGLPERMALRMSMNSLRRHSLIRDSKQSLKR